MSEAAHNATVIINDVSYNATALAFWNYTAYENGTLSNGSECYLTFDDYRPILISPNGTFANTTSCYTPVNPIGARGITGLVFGSLFALSIVMSTINLRKHGRAYLPHERRWKPVGRRWPWYWTIFVGACGLLSCFTAVDVDRDYIVNLPLILQSFFLTLTIPTALACVWEAVRSWTSFMHRQIHDADPFGFRPTDAHAKIEFYLPLVFYAFDWVVFFLVIPRGWTFVQKQRSDLQTLISARPSALDARFRAGSMLAIVCLGLIVFRLAYSSRVYRVRIPWILLTIVLVTAIRLAYMLAGSWIWRISPYRLEVSIGWLYGLGYAPVVAILFLLNLRGYLNDNEEKVLIAERTLRGDERGTRLEERRRALPKQSQQNSSSPWWSRTRAAMPNADRIFKTPTSPIPGERGTGTDGFEVGENLDESGHFWWQRRKQEAGDTRHRKSNPVTTGSSSAQNESGHGVNAPSLRSRWTEDEDLSGEVVTRTRTSGLYAASDGEGGGHLSSTTSLQSPPQVVRSMLDV